MEKRHAENKIEQPGEPTLMHDFKGEKKQPFITMKVGIIFLIVILLGIGTGYFLSGGSSAKTVSSTDSISKSQLQSGQTYGVSDTKSYPDTAEGTLQTGGINGEGQYHLVRPGGDSQNVYMTSSTVDLSLFVGKKIKVWGATQAAQYAGWLMDVGKVQVE
ncbi:MAG TPA: hypothetical protein VMR41_02070 [Patescibacteria group bacterium]|nr:hypothetical protein [Patescibacteria group bacterium]